MHAAAMTWLVEDVQKISALNQLKGKILEAKRVPPPPMFESMSADKLSLPQSPMSRRTSSSSKRQNGLCHHQGDQSGTHIAELNLWKAANTDIEKDNGPWYKSIGQGMGAALSFANASNCYVLSDRGTWIHFKNKGDLQILVEGDNALVQSVRRYAGEPGQAPGR